MSQAMQPIDVRSVQDRVYGSIREAMRKGVFTSGQPLTIRALAARFGTSEMPVREAFKRLVAEKALVQQADRTFQVPAVTPDRFDEVLLVRIMIEGRATELTALTADARLVAQLRDTNELMIAALSRSDVAGILEHNQHFHFLVYEACGNVTLLELIELLWLRSGPYLAALAADRAGINAFFDAAESHSRIIAGIEGGDAAAAAQALKEDIETTARWFWSRLSPEQEAAGRASPKPSGFFEPVLASAAAPRAVRKGNGTKARSQA